MTASLRIHFLLSSMLLAASALAVAGCTSKSHPIGGDDAGMTSDGGPGGGEACGPVTCGEGLVCCNASCGVCTAPGEGCIAIDCEDAGPGPCVSCAAPPPGCHYEGGSCESCGTLVCDEVCGTRGGITCEADEYCDYDAGCGFDDGGGECKPRPDFCTEDCPGVCGCDRNTYCNACDAATHGVDVLHDGACETSEPCDAQDARGVGPCAAFFGYAWDGFSCRGLSGCDCEGTDCDETFDTMEACQRAYAECTGDTCGTIAGLTCGADEWCDYHGGGCGFADGGGVCRPRPSACADIWAPVCGCDGNPYGNECEAQGAGVDVQYVGECESTPSG